MIGCFFAEVLMNFIIEREKEKPHYLSWQAIFLIVLTILMVIVFLII